MASQNRTTTHALTQLLETDSNRFDFFAAVRLIEALNAKSPRFGTSIKIKDDAVRFSQEPELQFPTSTLAHYQPAAEYPARLAVNFFGLFGPNGALPLHLTEYARERLRHSHDPTISRFADIFHHRMISLFYRAWANSRPTVSYDRPENDRFGFYIGALQGKATSAFHHRDELSDHAKWFYSGYFSGQTKNPEGLSAIIGDILGTSVKVQEFVGEWMAIQLGDQSRLGSSPRLATLGQSALLGDRVWGCQHKFTLVLGPLTLQQYMSLLPGANGLAQLIAIVRNYIGEELVWDANLVLKKQEVPRELVLGESEIFNTKSMNGLSQLGWSMWLGPRNSDQDADDLLLNPHFKYVG